MADDNTRRDDSVSEEISAFGERTKGAAKDAAGSITGNRRLEREGELENAEGRARQASNDVFDETDGVSGRNVTDTTSSPVRASSSMTEEAAATGERMKGAVKEATGSVLGLDRMEREGQVENARGRARQDANDAFGNTTTSSDRSGTRDRDLVTGLYDSPEHAGRAYHDLTNKHGYKADDISVLMSDETRRRHFGDVKPGTEFKTGRRQPKARGWAARQGWASGPHSGHCWRRPRRLSSRVSAWSSPVRWPARLRALAPAALQARSSAH